MRGLDLRLPERTASTRDRQPTAAAPTQAAEPTAIRPGAGQYAAAVLVLIVVILAVWWIGGSLIGPPASIPSAAALLSASQLDTAVVERARGLVEREPLADDAYAVLALAAEKAGQDERATRLMRIAAAFWPRNLLAQSWLLARSLRLGEPQAALSRFDVIARGHPESLDAMTEALAPILTDPATAATLADMLAADPPWRARFLDIAVRQWRFPVGVINLMDRIQARPPGLSEAELRPYLIKLLATGRGDQAYLSWLRSLPDARRSNLGFLYNGHFQYPVADMPFDWEMPPVPGVRHAITGPPEQRVLTVGFLGTRVALQPVQHDLFLAPGAYRLTGRVATDRLRTEQGVRWRIACLEHPDRDVAWSELFNGSAGWRDFAMDFTLPDTGCDTQTLDLEVYARFPEEQEASGIASFAVLDIRAR